MRNAWSRGAAGRNIGVYLSSFGVNNLHEDLVGGIRVFTNRPTNREAGTALMGAIRANFNNFGVTGIAYDCIGNFYDTDISNIDLILADFHPGDVIAISNEIVLGNVSRVPMVHDAAFWSRINLLARSGAIVIFAAGDGGLNLRQYSLFNNLGDSGGIMAGACISLNELRNSSTNFNLYLSANSWGDSVTTTGFGSLQNPPFPYAPTRQDFLEPVPQQHY